MSFSENIQRVDNNEKSTNYIMRDLSEVKEEFIRENTVPRLQDIKREHSIIQLSQLPDEL